MDPIERAREAFGDVREAPGIVRTSIKCALIPCTFEGRDAVLKMLVKDTPPWRFYMKRERAIYERFSAMDLPVRVPEMYAGSDMMLILERMRGRPLAIKRHETLDDREVWTRVIDSVRAIRTIACDIDVPPTEEDRAAMRERSLEDPTSDWIAEGLRETKFRVKRGPFQHGDLLLRNIFEDGSIVDWECAGTHAEGWDAALLSVFAPTWVREELARDLDEESYRACFAFALMREIRYRRGKRDAITERLERELEAIS